MFKCNRIPKIALLVLLLAFAYLAVLILLGQERAMDWGLSCEVMYLHAKLLSLAAAAGGIATWLLGMYRAHLQGSWWWFIACMFLWPVDFVYTLVFNIARVAYQCFQTERASLHQDRTRLL